MRGAKAAVGLVLAIVAVAAAGPVGQAENTLPLQDPLVVAVLDTGIDARHAEFAGFRGPAGTPDGQILAWWDFGLHANPGPGETWDPLTPVPYDPHGHGTATASLVGGLGLGTCPGVRLAIAKVSDDEGALVGDLAAAVRWAVKTVGADVLSLSFGSQVPFPAYLDDLDEALNEARALGVLPVASAGNGLLGQGLKSPSEFHTPAGAPAALSVGAAWEGGGLLGTALGGSYANLDPEVTAWGTDVPVAAPGGGYGTLSGTSFSAPKVAGWAACLMGDALAAQREASPDRIEHLLKFTARDDPLIPYALEGYGWVDDATLDAARVHAVAGTTPWHDSPLGMLTTGPDAVAEALRYAWWDLAEPQLVTVPLPSPQRGVLGASPGLLAGQAEAYGIPASPLDVVEVEVQYTDTLAPVKVPFLGPQGLTDLGLLLFPPPAQADLVLSWNELGAASNAPARGGLSVERLQHVAGFEGSYLLLVYGNHVPQDQPFALRAWVNGQPVEPVYRGDVLVAGAF